jgi:hypothetical protein
MWTKDIRNGIIWSISAPGSVSALGSVCAMSPDQFDLVWEIQPLWLVFFSLVSRLAQQANPQAGRNLSSSSTPAVRRVVYCQ